MVGEGSARGSSSGGGKLSLPSLPSPLPSPPGEGGGGGEEKEGEPMYIDREDMGKEKTPSEIERDASMWRPPGNVLIRCKWIHI